MRRPVAAARDHPSAALNGNNAESTPYSAVPLDHFFEYCLIGELLVNRAICFERIAFKIHLNKRRF
jgi:hypothetical protein